MMRDELRRRQAYLHAMGITAWYPRVLLPGAPSPLDWSDGEDPAAEQQGFPQAPSLAEPTPTEPLPAELPPAELSEPALRRSGAKLEVAIEPSPARRARTDPPAPAGRPTPEASTGRDAEAPPRFSLVFLNAGAGLGLVALLPQTAEAWLGPVRRGLLTELLGARTGLRLAPDLGEQPFRWPLGPGLDDSAEAARAALGGFLDHQAEEAGCRLLLVLGEQLTPLLPLGAQTQRGIPYPLPEQPWRLLLTRSLDEALAVPALKRELWHDLAPLAGALR